ncbi:ABC transporter substrate-binding protein [Aureimonas flava]|uniref:ABC transporter substrate-binding protein n=1 Tax=Aureimonas flava TaxID=2320271 RepID=A0A3A1WHB8_9HYPH|nr:ABC transporter substrate-binding protein [Aureimonas flava]
MKALTTVLVLVAAVLAPAGAEAQDKVDTLKLAIGQRGNWENAPAELGQEAGIFRKHGIVLESLYTSGGGETMQAVLSGSVDVGMGVGTGGILSAFFKGAPVRAIGNSTTGARDLYWYVPAGSEIQSMKDAGGRTIAFSTNGSSTNTTALGLIETFKVDAKPVATGNPSSTFTQVMSGQVDIGWASPPFGVEAVQQGKIRIIARGDDVPALRDQTVRLMITSAPTLDAKADAIKRFAEAYSETLDWMYSDPAAVAAYAKWVDVPISVAEDVREEFYPKENLRLDRLSGLDAAMQSAIDMKFLSASLSQEQLDELFQYQAGPVK